MAVDPVTIKIALQQTLKVITDEEKRNKIILSIVVLVAICLSIILIPIYLLTHPIDTIKMIITGQLDLSLITQMKQDYPVDTQIGGLTYKGKFPFPLEHANETVVTSIYGMRLDPIKGIVKKHTGVDLSGVHHDHVLVIANGTVTFAGVQNRIW